MISRSATMPNAATTSGAMTSIETKISMPSVLWETIAA